MTDKNLQTLTHIIVDQGISRKGTEYILKKLKRTDKKVLLQKIKLGIQKNKLTVTTSQILDAKTQNMLKETFRKTKIETIVDPSLGAGMIIQDNDTIYDMSIKGRLEHTIGAVVDSL